MALKEILESIRHPHKVTFEANDLTSNYGKFIAQPFERGYAVTIGNALRRVLLSSIPGYAITAIKIKDVSNEFENVEGMKEDTIVMIMHLKNVVVSLPDHIESKTIHVKKEGPCIITAKDLVESDSEVKVYNPDYYIATISEGYSFEMDIQIDGGYSYVPAEVSAELISDINAIVIDAIYSPIVSVNYNVEDIRVGQRIDYGRLTLEIETKGNIAPDKALSWAAKILKDNLLCFMLPEEANENDEKLEEAPKDSILDVLKDKHVEEVEFSIRTANFLISSDLKTLDKVALKSDSDLLRLTGANEMIIEEIKEKLEEYGAHLGMRRMI